MPLESGARLGPYEIIEPIGAGGMGEVFKARDTKLGREVAVKVLAEAFTQNPERLARFEREARLLASLNHPNIATIHDIEESDGVRFLVMELVPGETLAERITQGPLAVEETLPIFRQIAEALEAAHEKGIIHGDLKPANVKITPDGLVKVLDFGLAKALVDEEPTADFSQSPTLTKSTALGAIMGTAAYMSPEQARGKTVDKRTDIWAFGCCLYEALTGRKAFEGETVTDTLAAVVNREPDWDNLPHTTPERIRGTLERCLRKDARSRLRDIGDARIDLAETGHEPSKEVKRESKTPSWTVVVAAMVLGAVVVAIFATWILRRPTSLSLEPRRLAINLPDEAPVAIHLVPTVAVSPDGKKIAYVARMASDYQIYLRNMNRFEAEPLPGTTGAWYLFFSPDGEWIGYFDLMARKLKKVWIYGGAPVDICDTGRYVLGASWGTDGTIVFNSGSTSGLYKVSASGGIPEVVTKPDKEKGEKTHRWPHLLPDGRSSLFTIGTSSLSTYEEGTIAVVSLETGEQKVLIEGGSYPLYLATGHIVYARAGSIMAVPFDLASYEVTVKR